MTAFISNWCTGMGYITDCLLLLLSGTKCNISTKLGLMLHFGPVQFDYIKRLIYLSGAAAASRVWGRTVGCLCHD